jgi:hypothetical protein
VDNESIVVAIIMAIVCFSCGLTFYLIGFMADKSTKPFGFWSGVELDPKRVNDLTGYNRANAIMWKVYSIPYWFAGIIGCFPGELYCAISGILLFLACIPGLFFLISSYRRIERQYLD